MSAPKFDCVLVRYGEIALKGGNRRNFEERLRGNLGKRLSADGISCSKVYTVSGRLIVDSKEAEAAAESLARVFGVTSASPAVKVGLNLKSITETALALFRAIKPKPSSFKVSATRLDKKISENSQEINEIVGARIVEATKCKVSLKNPEAEVGVEAGNREAYVYTKTFPGVAGLPVGVAGKVVVLFSGGIDSPVAAYLCMKRGCEVTLLHLVHGDSARPPKKLESIRATLGKYHPHIPLVIVPAGGVERELVMKVPAEYRIIILRRMLLLVAEKIASQRKAAALASGDNLGQVASQTLENMGVISQATGLLILRPLLSYDKREIIDLARKIGTYQDSIIPHQDCCNFLLPKHPATAAKLPEIQKIEEQIDPNVIEKAVDKKTVL